MNPIPGETPVYPFPYKNNLFVNVGFHIAIENVRKNNWFTEKLIDCFVTKTLPIYWGAPNIGEYFNINGILVCNNVDDIIREANNISMEIYNSKLDAIEENYKIAQKYNQFITSIEGRLEQVIMEKIR
jgi:hypothetical protein